MMNGVTTQRRLRVPENSTKASHGMKTLNNIRGSIYKRGFTTL